MQPAPMPATAPTYAELPLDLLIESPTNPRKRFDPKDLADLAASIQAQGVVQPIVVRRRGDIGLVSGVQTYEIVAGARRVRAAKQAGLAAIPAMVRELGDAQVVEIQIIENLQRKDVHPLDEATGYEHLINVAGLEVEDIAARVGKSTSYVYQRIQLLKLSDKVRDAFLADDLSAGHAVLIARLQVADQQEALAYCNNSWRKVGVRELTDWIESNVHRDLRGVAWKKDDATLVPAAGACSACSKRTGAQRELFEDNSKKDHCLDPACFQQKNAAAIALVRQTAKAAGETLLDLSTHYSARYGEKYPRGALFEPHYKEASKNCGTAQAGVWIDGPRKGRLAQVCTDKKCEIHWPKAPAAAGPTRRGNKAQTRKAQAQRQARAQAVALIAAKVTKADDELVRFVGRAFVSEMWSDHLKEFGKRQGWDMKGHAHKTPILAELTKRKGRALLGFVLSLALSGKLVSSHAAELDKVGKRHGVNIASLERRMLATLTAQNKAKGKTKSKVPATAKPKRAARVAKGAK